MADFRFVLAVAFTVVSMPTFGQTAPPRGQSPSFQVLFDRYLHGDADGAVQELASWDQTRVDAEATREAIGEEGPWRLAALAMLLSEAGIRRGTFGSGRPEVRFWDGELYQYEAYYRRARGLIDDLVSQIGQDGARPASSDLSAFCRRWFVVASPRSIGRASPTAVPDLWNDHPDILLLKGMLEEYWMGPEIHGPPVGFSVSRRGEFGAGPRVSTSHGRFHPVGALEAIGHFRRALERQPAMTEARLRLGRVLYLMDRSAEAEPELERALRDAKAGDDVFSGYLAALFLGQLHEDAGRADAAERLYRAAVSIHPAGQTARLALGRLLLLRPARAAAWRGIQATLETSAVEGSSTPDPWYHYGYMQPRWRLAEDLLELRQLVRSRK